MTTASQPCIFKVGETYKTRGGGTARVICTDAKDSFPIVALHKASGHERVVQHLLNGRWSASAENKLDLLLPELVKVKRWFGMYPKSKHPFGCATADEITKDAPDAVPVEAVFTFPPDIAAQCDWLKDAEIVDETES